MTVSPCESDDDEIVVSRRGAVVLVTGGSGGIGRAVALHLASKGLRVVLSGRRLDALAAVQAEIVERGGDATVLAADLTDTNGPASLVAATLAWQGRLDGVISCAGAARFTFFNRMSAVEFTDEMQVNLLAPIAIVRAAMPELVRARRGFVVFINSIVSRAPAPARGTGYVTAKAGLLHFSESLFAEIRDSGVAVTSILPDLTDTPMIPDRLGYDRTSLIDPVSIADAVWFVITPRGHACITELHLRSQPSLRMEHA
jgi:short-subunit dehydrogenase